MIHDAQVEVTCDADCAANEFIDLRAGARNTYIAEDSSIERKLEQLGWIVRDGKHFCSEKCADTKSR